MKRKWAGTVFEKKHWREGKTLIAGVDEAGRGALAGPIVAAAVIMPPHHRLRVADSKLLSPAQREHLFVEIIKTAIAWSVAAVEAEQIDADGIDPANEAVVKLAISRLPLAPDHIYADAVRLRETPERWETIVDGDALISTVAAASIIAKVARDTMMLAHHQYLPHWHFHLHKGYGTAQHQALIHQHGLSPIHRRSFISQH